MYELPSLTWGANAWSVNWTDRLELRDDFSYTAGSHTWKIGGAYVRLTSPEEQAANLFGTWTFDAGQPFDGSAAAIARLRNPIQFQASFPPLLRELHNNWIQWYVQDQWRARDGLTLEFGLRYDNQDESFNTHLDLTLVPRLGELIDPASRGDHNNFGPRPLPTWGVIQERQPAGEHEYRALFLRLDRRFADRHQYLISYTLSKQDNNDPTGTLIDLYDPDLNWGPGNADRRHSFVASGSFLLPADVTFGAVWTLRSAMPFSALAGQDLNRDGTSGTDLVPGTSRNMGNRDNGRMLELVNAWRVQNRRQPISEDQIDANEYNRVDVRVSKAFALVVASVRGVRLQPDLAGGWQQPAQNRLSSATPAWLRHPQPPPPRRPSYASSPPDTALAMTTVSLRTRGPTPVRSSRPVRGVRLRAVAFGSGASVRSAKRESG